MVICISTVRRLFQFDRQILLSSHELISVFLLSGETDLVDDEYLLWVFFQKLQVKFIANLFKGHLGSPSVSIRCFLFGVNGTIVKNINSIRSN